MDYQLLTNATDTTSAAAPRGALATLVCVTGTGRIMAGNVHIQAGPQDDGPWQPVGGHIGAKDVAGRTESRFFRGGELGESPQPVTSAFTSVPNYFVRVRVSGVRGGTVSVKVRTFDELTNPVRNGAEIPSCE